MQPGGSSTVLSNSMRTGSACTILSDTVRTGSTSTIGGNSVLSGSRSDSESRLEQLLQRKCNYLHPRTELSSQGSLSSFSTIAIGMVSYSSY